MHYTSKCDLYAIGIIFYTMLCGYPPFDEEDPEFHLKVKSGQFDFPKEEWGRISKDVVYLIQNMLDPSPQKRKEIVEIISILKNLNAKNEHLNVKVKLVNFVKKRKLKATQLAIHFMSLLKKKVN